jgi:hypothetical protein
MSLVLVWVVWFLVSDSNAEQFSPGKRQVVDLNGTWDFLPVWKNKLIFPPPKGEWRKTFTPEYWGGYPEWTKLAGEPPLEWKWTPQEDIFRGPDKLLPCAWYRKTVSLPPVSTGHRAKITFMAVAHRAWVYFNGKFISEHWGGFTPFTVDVTNVIKPGENELLVGVGDHRSVTHESWIRENALTPIGAMYPFFRGIWQEVYLQIVSDTYVEDVFIMPSVREMILKAQVTLRNEGKKDFQGTLHATVTDQGRTVKEFTSLPITIETGKEKTIFFSEPFPNAELWWPDHPKLYHMKVSLSQGKQTIDVRQERFGFREFWIDGRHFKLNGAIIKLWAIWGHTGEYSKSGAAETDEATRKMWREIKKCNIHAARLHGQPMVPRLLNSADEEGILLIAESALYGGNHHLLNFPSTEGKSLGEAFRKNSFRHVEEWVKRDRNHPSLVLWTSSNEFSHTHIPRTPTVTRFLLDLQNYFQTLDPTRPVKHSGYGGMDEKEMTIDFHSVQNQSIPPNGYFWAVQDIGSWNKQDRNFGSFYPKLITQINKPVCVGEDTSEPNASALVGQKYFKSPQERIKGLAELWRVMMNAYRVTDVALEVFFPFFDGPIPNEFLTALTDVFKPVGIFHAEYANHFFAGEKARRTLVTYNETYHPKKFTIRWEIWNEKTIVGQGKDSFFLPPGENKKSKMEFRFPSQMTEKTMTLTVRLFENDKETDTLKIPYRVYPSKNTLCLPDLPFALVDPEKKTAKVFDALKIKYTPITTLKGIDRFSLVVFGDPAPATPLSPRRSAELKRFVEKGGRVVFLHVKNIPPELGLNAEMVKDSRATAAFPDLNAPRIFKGLDAEEFKFWREDNFIADDLFQKPTLKGAKVFLVAGWDLGLTPFFEIPSGKGSYLICQLSLIEKARVEPVCLKLLENILSYSLEKHE